MEHNVKNVFLKLHDEYYPFNRLSEKRAREAAEQMRFFYLKKGERLFLVTGKPTEALYVVSGGGSGYREGGEGKTFPRRGSRPGAKRTPAFLTPWQKVSREFGSARPPRLQF